MSEKENEAIKPESDRISERLPASRKARLIDDDEGVSVDLVDLGLEGFGVTVDREYPEGTMVTLEDSTLLGVEYYQCEVVFCEEKPDGFHLGLHVRDREEALVFGEPEDLDGEAGEGEG